MLTIDVHLAGVKGTSIKSIRNRCCLYKNAVGFLRRSVAGRVPKRLTGSKFRLLYCV